MVQIFQGNVMPSLRKQLNAFNVEMFAWRTYHFFLETRYPLQEHFLVIIFEKLISYFLLKINGFF